MKIILDNKFNIVDVEDTLDELLVKGSNRFDKLAVFIPTALKEQYDSIYPTYAVKRADGRELGNYTMPNSDSSVENCYGWAAPFNSRDLAVEGALQITITFTLNGTIKKTVCNVATNVRKALQVNDDIYVIGDGNNAISVMNTILESIDNFRSYGYIELSNNILTDAQAKQITDFNYFVAKVGGRYFTPAIYSVNVNSITFITCYAYEYISNANGYYTLTASKLEINLTAKTYTLTSEAKNTYTKEKVDTLFSRVDESIGCLDLTNKVDEYLTQDELATLIKYNKRVYIKYNGSYYLPFRIVAAGSSTDEKLIFKKIGFVTDHYTDGVYDYRIFEMPYFELQISGNNYTWRVGTDYASIYDKNQINNKIYALNTSIDASGHKIQLEMDSSTYKFKVKLYDKNNNLISTSSDIDLPLESVVVNASYNSTTKKLVLTLQNGNTVEVSLTDLIDGLVPDYSSGFTPATTYKAHIYNEDGEIKFATEYPDDIEGGETEFSQSRAAIKFKAITVEYNHPDGTEQDTYELNVDATGLYRASGIKAKKTVKINGTITETKEVNLLDLYQKAEVNDFLNRAYYHLGAYDSANGKTRRTWYVDLETLEWVWLETYSCWYASTNLPPNSSDSADPNIVSANYVARTINAVVSQGLYGIALNSVSQLYVRNGSTTERPSGILQYKLATSYTEDIIPNRPLLNLDANMANKLRQKVVDGLNIVFAHFNKIVGSGSTTGTWNDDNFVVNNNSLSDPYVFGLEGRLPKGTYTLSFDCNEAIDRNIYLFGDGGFQKNILVDNTHIDYTFTLTSDINISIRFSGKPNDSGTTTYSNLMIVEADHSYPYSDFNQKEHITNDEATLLKQEEEKCRNLFTFDKVYNRNNYGTLVSITSNSFVMDGALQYSYVAGYLQLKPNTKYTFSLVSTNPQCNIHTTCDGTTTETYDKSHTFTTGTSGVVRFIIYSTLNNAISGNVTISNIMLNKGSEAKPYQKHYGPIVHTTEIEPVLLWENGNPNDSFVTQNITLSQNLTNFKFLVIAFKDYKSNFWGSRYEKVSTEQLKYFLVGGDHSYRSFDSNGTTIAFDDAKASDDSINDDYIIPVKIYGTNIL